LAAQPVRPAQVVALVQVLAALQVVGAAAQSADASTVPAAHGMQFWLCVVLPEDW
jgi:hypothetical protein